MYHFVRITPANFLYALWLSLRGRVAAWKVVLPERLARRFGRVRPYHIWSRDQWLLAHDRAFDLWKTQAFPLLAQRFRHTALVGKHTVDFSRNLWQLLGIELEALCLFAAMLETAHPADGGTPQVIAPRIAAAFSDEELRRMFPRVRIVRSAANRFLENLHEWSISAAHLGRQIAWFGMSLTAKAKPLGRRACAWFGVSPTEHADRDDRLDFSWAARYGHVAPDDIAYFLVQDLTGPERRYFDSRGIAYVEPADTFAVLPVDARTQVIGASLAAFVAASRAHPVIAPLIARFMTRAPYWDALFDTLGTTTYVTTGTFSWPEKPELAVTAARGIRSIMWAYSANTLTFTVEKADFRDLGVLRSIVIADEFWCWNRAYAKWTENRSVNAPGDACDFRVVGPLMCGDASLLALDPADARERVGLPREGFCIGVFDMPPPNDEWRDRFGGGPPMIDMATYVEFWNVIERVVLRVPGAYALVKLKRDFGHAYKEFPDFLREFLDENGEHARAGRIYRVDVNVDPYLPVAACDIAVGLAYTSPVLAARTAGRPGYYLDPLKLANHPSNPDYKAITLNTEEELLAAVLRARDDSAAPLVSAPDVTPPPAVVPLQPASADRAGPREEAARAACHAANPA